MAVTVEIIGVERVVAMFKDRASRVRRSLSSELRRLAIDLAGIVKNDYLSGQVLRNRTGDLRRSTHANPVQESGDDLSVSVGNNLIYARVHELGGTFSFREKTQYRRGSVGYKKSTKAYPISWQVRAYIARYPRRAFLAPALDAYRGQIRDRLEAAVGRAVAGSV